MDFPGRTPGLMTARNDEQTSRPRGGRDSVSAGVKLGGFLLLLAAIFAGAHAVGAHLGPVSSGSSQPGGGSSMHMGGSGSMNMGRQPAPQARLRGGRP
jgi:hypothetical protein